MKFNLLVNSGSSLAVVETVTMDNENWQFLKDQLNLQLETGISATSAGVRLAEVLERYLSSRVGEVVDFAAAQLADLLRAVSVHHSAILEYRP